jgi:hypothetical protein
LNLFLCHKQHNNLALFVQLFLLHELAGASIKLRSSAVDWLGLEHWDHAALMQRL